MDVLAAKSMIESSTSCDFDEYIKTYSGIATFFRAKHTRNLAETDIALVGCRWTPASPSERVPVTDRARSALNPAMCSTSIR